MRNKKLAWNTISSLVFQVMTIICGFVLPRLIMHHYGSGINGLINSITQFLQMIAFLELGVGAVVQSALYKPLAEKNNEQISKILASANRFFKKIAFILVVYVVILAFLYPEVSGHEFDWLYTATLIICMSISSFAQYYFGVVDRLLLTADQKGYIQYNAQTITLVINTAFCAVLIKLGCSIHIVKLVTSAIFLVRPLVLHWYVNCHYSIDRSIRYSGEPIKQKWNGMAQHIAAVIMDSTDSVVLTMFATLSDVSIYSVYHFVVYGIKQLFSSMVNGIKALLGELWATQNKKELMKYFSFTEWIIHTGVVFIYGCTVVLIVPFALVYTAGVQDANYNQPLFAAIITLANAMYCLRIPYNLMVLASGHYKQTQNYYLIAAIINISISIITVSQFGLVGVAVGTLAAMTFHTVWLTLYNARNLLKYSLHKSIKQYGVDFLSVIVGVILTKHLQLGGLSYFFWVKMAMKVAIIWAMTIVIVNLIFYRKNVARVWSAVLRKLRAQKS